MAVRGPFRLLTAGTPSPLSTESTYVLWKREADGGADGQKRKMAVRGQRFTVDLPLGSRDDPPPDGRPSVGVVGDVVEKFPSAAPQPPRAPPATSTTGFPAHKKRSRASVPEVGSDASSEVRSTADRERRAESGRDGAFDEDERRRIDEENRRRLESMSEEEIELGRQEILQTLGPSLIGRLLRRAEIRDGPDRGPASPSTRRSTARDRTSSPEPRPSSAEGEPPSRPKPPRIEQAKGDDGVVDPDAEPVAPPADLVPASTGQLPPLPRTHFPARPSPPPELDPSAPDFLDALHDRYYPDLAADPAKLAWMAPVSTDDDDDDDGGAAGPGDDDADDGDGGPTAATRRRKRVAPPSASSYSPSLPSLPASALRFDFRGTLLPPRRAREVPVSVGLHHHGDAPEAAGYTVPELARLARSVFPAQRCIAYQTLGRILYRLGSGLLGDPGSDLVVALWRCIHDGRVLETLQREAAAAVAPGPPTEALAAAPPTRTDAEPAKTTGEQHPASPSMAGAAAEATATETTAGEGKRGGGGDGDGRPAHPHHHRTAGTLAVEALWNWQRGGGQRWKAQ